MNLTTISMDIKYKNEILFIDNEDLETFNSHTWHIFKNKSRKYLRTSKRVSKDKVEFIWFHRLIMGLNKIDYKTNMIDHINGDGLDNRKSNLRIVNNRKNQLNSKNHIDSKIPYKGVYYRTAKKKFVARININGIRKQIGSFDNAYDAALAYDKYILDNKLEFNKLNFS